MCRFSLFLLSSVCLLSVWFSKPSFLISCICIFLILRINDLFVFIFSLLTCPVHSQHHSARCLNSGSSSRFDCYQRWRTTSDTRFLPIVLECHVSSERWWSTSSTASFFSLLFYELPCLPERTNEVVSHWRLYGFVFRVSIHLDWLALKTKEFSLTCYLIHGWVEKRQV